MHNGGPGEAGTDWARGNPGQAGKVGSKEGLPLTRTVQPGGQSQRARFPEQRTTESAPWRAPSALRWGSLAWRMLSQQDLSPGKTRPPIGREALWWVSSAPWRGEGTLKGPGPYFPIRIMNLALSLTRLAGLWLRTRPQRLPLFIGEGGASLSSPV